MKIKWLGHSCFLITSQAGTKILTDPFDSKVGYAPPVVEADIVTTSHNHYDHNYILAVKGEFKHLDRAGIYALHGIGITGISTFHDEVLGAKRGNNIIFIFDVDGLRICHCGDLGHIPAPEQLAAIGRIDILLIPVGGTYTVNADEAVQAVGLLKPQVTIPMHYRTPALTFPIDSVDKFLAAAGISKQEAYIKRQEIDIDPGNPAELPKVIVLDYE